ncbi:MAG: DUF5050 domain-containing protein [Oscillospiraceae bacterium]|nr:DUF5050 domain-containing protein [Oscillospiraceae bacterium]
MKKLLSIITALAITLASFTLTVSAESFVLGDVNGDGVVTIADALEILKYLAKLPENAITKGGKDSDAWNAATINGGDAPSINDALEVLKKLAKLDNKIDELSEFSKVFNKSGNILNGGIAAYQSGWIYYTDSVNGIWKVRTNDTDKTQLTDDKADYLNVVGDWIYYNGSDINDPDKKYNLRKIRTDGTEKTDINKVNSTFVNVAGDTIYYTNSDDNHNIYKINTDGTNGKKLVNNSIIRYNLEDEFVYYSALWDMLLFKDRFYSISTDGGDSTTINGIDFVGEKYLSISFIVNDGWIYHESMSADSGYTHHFCKISVDGTQSFDITPNLGNDYNIISYNTDGDRIYFSTADALYKMNIDGTDLIKISDTKDVDNINIIGKWIYYKTDSKSLYRMDKNGNEIQSIS